MKATEWKPYESHVVLQRLWGFLPLPDITAEGLHMEIEREDYWEPNQTTPLLEMFTEWHTEGSRNYGRMAYRTESRITLPEAYQMTTEKPTDILPKLPTEMAADKSTKIH